MNEPSLEPCAELFDLNALNKEQRSAVTAPPNENLLVLAGAGSGKTRVLTHRFAWLVQAANCSPYAIMALTFTNKAAAEMRQRIEALLERPLRGLWARTFHGTALQLLRMHSSEAGLPEGFQILDQSDQHRLVEQTLKSLNQRDIPPRLAAEFINTQKEEFLRADQVTSDGEPLTDTLIDLYLAYESICKTRGLVDFAEMLLRIYELFRDDAALLNGYRERFSHLLIDEFQDTNTLQYEWVKLLAGKTGYVAAVGDDDQSIYGWRGARIENIHSFQNDFKAVRLIKLEQNYRSTGNILKAANAVIKHNTGRVGKTLWTALPEGEPVRCYVANNEQDEANFILDEAEKWHAKGLSLAKMAILYRQNAQSRALESACLSRGLPYIIYGGTPFYKRAEIKNAVAYMQLVAHPHADEAFMRVVNFPPRGIGQKTLDTLRLVANSQNISLWQAASDAATAGQLQARPVRLLQEFCQLISQLQEKTLSLPLGELADLVITDSGITAHYLAKRDISYATRIENLEELVSACQTYIESGVLLDTPEQQPSPEQPDNPLRSFLDHIALEASISKVGQDQDALQLMTMHSVKGLEFPLVFIAGMEEGVLPHYRSIDDTALLEEERRLCYVGITRAMEALYVVSAETRMLHGRTQYGTPSRFIRELPKAQLQHIGVAANVFAATAPDSLRPSAQAGGAGFSAPSPGARVLHETFGTGTVLAIEGDGAHTKAHVHFHHAGKKWLMLSYAHLKTLS